MVRSVDPNGGRLGKADEPMQTRKDGHERVRKDVKTKLFSRKRKGSGQERERVES